GHDRPRAPDPAVDPVHDRRGHAPGRHCSSRGWPQPSAGHGLGRIPAAQNVRIDADQRGNVSMLKRSALGVSSCLLLWLAGAGPVGGEDPAVLAPGVVADVMAKGSAAEKAGIKPGDVIVSWFRASSPPANPEPVQGQLVSPFDLVEVEVEQAPRG